MIDIDHPILNYLFENKDFLESLQNEFEKEEIIELKNYSQNINNEYPVTMDRFYDWFECEFDNPDINVLSIAWDSDGGGPGGNGFVRFNSRFGIVKMESSDFSDEHIEIFNKKTFVPWCIGNLMNDYIELNSDVYSEKKLLILAKKMGMYDHTKLTIKGNEIER